MVGEELPEMVIRLQGTGSGIPEVPPGSAPQASPPATTPGSPPPGSIPTPAYDLAIGQNLTRQDPAAATTSETTFPPTDGRRRSGRPASSPQGTGPTGPKTGTAPGPTATAKTDGYWDELGSLTGAVGAAIYTGRIEVGADKLRDGHNHGVPDKGYGPGMANPYYAAQANGTQMRYWATYLGALPLASSLTGGALSKLGQNAITGRPAFEGMVETLSPARALANVMGHAGLEDALYWQGMDKNVDLGWLSQSFGDDVGRALSTEVGSIPQSYFMGAGAFAAPFLGQYRANNAGRQNCFGFGGSNPVMDGLDAMSRFGDAAGATITAISGISGQRMGGTVRAAMGVNTLNAMMNGLAFADQLWREKDYLGAGAATILTTLNAFGQATAASAQDPKLSGTGRTLSLTGAAAGLTLGIWQYLRGKD
jgi:hypothetical protein